MTTLHHDDVIAEIANRFDGIVWTDVVTRAQGCPALPDNVLLHAGPPLTGTVPAPIRAAAIEAILFEGWAEDHFGAGQLLDNGEIRLVPAQDHGVVTPLAQVVSMSMPLFCVTRNESVCYAPIVESSAPALRFGKPGPSARAHLQLFAHFGMHVLKPALREQPVAVNFLIHHALTGGEECHALTARANHALAAQFNSLHSRDRHIILSNPGFVLPLLMAACALLLKEKGQIVAAGGNGQTFGYRLRSADGWHVTPATPPQGTRFPAYEKAIALGAIGDSAVIDFCGLGAQALALSPTLAHEWREFLPSDLHMHRSQVLDPHSGTVNLGSLMSKDLSPMVNLAVLDQAAEIGLIGRGVFRLPNRMQSGVSELFSK
jgi:hypothetical protein